MRQIGGISPLDCRCAKAHRLELKKKTAVCLVPLFLLLGGCGQGSARDTADASTALVIETSNQNITLNEIYEEITKTVSISSAVMMSDDFITKYYGIGIDKLEDYVFYMSEEATSAETIAIMKVKDEADAVKISEALQAVVEQKRGEMKDYLPEQFEIVDKSVVITKGNYVYLVISEQAEDIKRIIEENI